MCRKNISYSTKLKFLFLFEAFTFLKSNRELWENSQQLISRAISMRKVENSRAYKRMEEDETKEKRMNGDNN